MDAENLVINEGGNRQEVKEVCEELPDGRAAVLFLTLGVEPVYLGGLPRLMVSSEQVESKRIPQL